MNQQFSQLSGKGLLAAMVATLICGQSFADVAGRVTFVAGKVTAIGSDGNTRTLTKGELLNSGERLDTGTGRLQIRFTDGSLMSLQPNTVFGLDNYTFSRNKPQDGTLLFNFIRGGIRTVSGAIGRVNRANYAVKTPVGTIGIRGTGYTATQEPNGRLLVTVNKGIVNISNEFGNRDISSGQTFQIQQDKAPEPAESGVMAEAPATPPQAQEENNTDSPDTPPQVADEINLGLDILQANNDFEQSNQSDSQGQPNVQVFPFFIQSLNGKPRLSHFASLLQGASGSVVHQNIYAAFDKVSTDGLAVGNLVGLIDSSSNKLLLDTRNTVNPVKFNGVKQVRSLSFGEWTNGSMATADNSININTFNLDANTFIPYIVGTSASQNLGNNQRISYRLANLADASPARANQSIGQLTQLNIDFDLNTQPLISVNMALSLDGLSYTASTQNQPLNLQLGQNLSSFSLNGLQDNFFATTGNNSLCNNKACPVNLSGFFSGGDVGAIYDIDRPNNLANIGGVAVLTGAASTTIVSNIANSAKVESSLTGKYTALFGNNAGISISPNPVSNLAAIFNSTTGGLQLAFHQANNTASDIYGAVSHNGQAAAQSTQIQHAEKLLTWGVWSNGGVDVNDPVQSSYGLSNAQQIHYIIGSPTLTLPTTNRVLYSFQGGTTPTVDGQQGTQAQVTNQSYLDINFGANTVGLNLNLQLTPTTGSSQTLNASGTTSLLGSGSFNFDALNIKLGTGNTCNNLGCSGTATGFLVGNTAQWGALNYTLSAVSDSFNNGLFIHTQGVAAFKQDANFEIPVSQLSNSTSPIYRALLSTQINDNPQIDINLHQTNAVSAQFDNQSLAWSSGSSVGGSAYGYSTTPSSNAATEVTHYKQTLSWGRWINSTVNVGDANNPLTLAANDSVHYIVGTPSASLPSSGTVTYSYAGGTTPTGTITTPTTTGSPANTISPLAGVNVLNSSTMQVNFASTANDAIKLDMGFSTTSQGNIRFEGQSPLNTNFSLSNLTVNSQSCQNCAANGFFAGNNGAMIGLNYDLTTNLGQGVAEITGVAAFEKTAP
jgi:hypothetical protein